MRTAQTIPQVFLIFKSEWHTSNAELEKDLPGNSETAQEFINRTASMLLDVSERHAPRHITSIEIHPEGFAGELSSWIPMATIHYTEKF